MASHRDASCIKILKGKDLNSPFEIEIFLSDEMADIQMQIAQLVDMEGRCMGQNLQK